MMMYCRRSILVPKGTFVQHFSFVCFQMARDRCGTNEELALPKFTSLKSMSGSEDGLDRYIFLILMGKSSKILDRILPLTRFSLLYFSFFHYRTLEKNTTVEAITSQQSQQQRTNSSVHVCWHR